MAYCCTTLSAINLSCGETNAGGIRLAYAACKLYVTATESTTNKGQLETLTIENGKSVPLSFRKQSSSVTTTYTVDDPNGVMFFTTEANLVFAKQSLEKRQAITNMLGTDMCLFYEDCNGEHWMMGFENPCTMSAMTGQTGQAMSDGNNYSITIQDISGSMPMHMTKELWDTTFGA